MYIHLSWQNPNVVDVVTRIYRADQPVDRNNPGVPIATLTNGETHYYDRGLTEGSTYHYAIEFVNGASRTISMSYPFTATMQRGPGEPLVLFGDDAYGYAGSYLRPSFNRLLAAIGVTRPAGAGDMTPRCYKYSVAGRLYYVQYIIASSVNTADILPFLQKREVSISLDGFQYRASPPDFTANNRTLTDMLMVPLMNNLPNAGRAGESLGRVGVLDAGAVILAATPPDAGNALGYRYDTDVLTEMIPILGSHYFAFILELVE